MYGSKEYRQKRDLDLRSFVESKSEIIDKIPDNYLRTLCYFALIENFAQEYDNYSNKKQSEVFCIFVLKFQTSYSFLDKLDPVTLYYEFETELKQHFDLHFLDHGVNYNPDHVVQHGKAYEMVEYLKSRNVRKNFDKHNFVRLLYSLRSKLSHELYNQHNMLATDLHLLKEYPYYLPDSTFPFTNDDVEPEIFWDLVIPVGFIRKLALEVINNYLDYSLKNKNDPFENNTQERKSVKTWYD